MTPEQLQRRADRIVDIARAFVADPDNDERRLAYLKATFNLDNTAAVIVALADRTGQEGSAVSDGPLGPHALGTG